MEKVIVAMSGGVDSAVCAYLLKEYGYEVIGISFIFFEEVDSGNIKLAKKISDYLGIQHLVIDVRREFQKEIIENFYDEYSRGLTPNPCVMCNRKIKFSKLSQEAERRGVFYISTGHYARIEAGKLFKGLDNTKDQSYVLYRLSPSQINRAVLPLGNMQKEQVRAIAQEKGLLSFCAKESQEICFVRGKSYTEHFGGTKKGAIKDVKTGETLGRHNGIEHFTIGQRKRLGIGHPTPLYVVSIEAETNTVYVGDFEEAHGLVVRVRDINWIVRKNEDFHADVKIRYTMKPEPAIVSIVDEDRVVVKFHIPQWAPAPGQSAVFYEGEMVIGGGVIY